ncbi:MAG: hypothetical protein L6R41_001432 [Letrouitia leprolyta]|nr:MAG: hypothetical protein L6R41_001432 [Letrouitia leprolyta]
MSTTDVNTTAPRRSGRAVTKSVKAQEIEADTIMPAALPAAPKAKKTASKKAATTVNASKTAQSKPKAIAKATFPNLPGAAGASGAHDQSAAEDSTLTPTTKKTKSNTAAKKAATTAKSKAPAAKKSKKRKTDNDDVTSEAEKSATEEPDAKRAKTTKTAVQDDRKASTKTKEKPAPKKIVINYAPTARLNVYVFGEGSSGELGLGTAKNAIDVKRPRLNAVLPAETVGVVHVTCGGMHVAALTDDGKVLTWGVNDQGALGRDTKWEGGLRDVGESDNESDGGSDSGLNPYESTPTAITTFPEGTVVVKLSAGDSHTLALTDEGLVFGWGTFRNNEGILGFNKDTLVQNTPTLLPGLKKIVDITSGANHALALDQKGVVYTWGSGQQNQLGFRMMQRKRFDSLNPSLLRLRGKNIRYIACGADHSFAIDGKEQVWSWGANSFGATGIYGNAGEDNAVIISPTVVTNLNLENDTITHMAGGTHHSLASTVNGRCLVWGRFDGSQTGIDASAVTDDDVVRDFKGNARILIRPTQVPGVQNCALVAAGTDHSLAITDDGKGYSWGFSANYQTGQGTDDDVTTATLFNNTVRDKHLNWAGAGGQYSILTALAEIDPITDNSEGASNSQAAIMSGALTS